MVSEPGWYPDPGGRPGHYRSWDGHAWAPTTTPDPSGGPPAGPPPRRSRAPWVLAGVALLIVLAVVATLVLVPGGPAPSPAPTATRTDATGDPTSAGPSASASAPASSSAPTPSPRPTTALRAEDCPIGDPLTRQDHPADGRVHGGGLSFRPPSSWVEGARAGAFSWGYDVGEADQRVRRTWFTGAAVGALSVADGAYDVQSGAELAMGCTATPFFYAGIVSRTDLRSEETTVDGYPAYNIRAEIRTDDPYNDVEGDVVQVTVVDLGSPESLAFFCGYAPIGDPDLLADLDAVTAQLRAG